MVETPGTKGERKRLWVFFKLLPSVQRRWIAELGHFVTYCDTFNY